MEPMPEQPVIEKPAEVAIASRVPAVEETVASAEPVQEAEADDVPAELLDSRLEYIVAMELVEPVSSVADTAFPAFGAATLEQAGVVGWFQR